MAYQRKRPIVTISPIVEYTKEQIRDIRMMVGISQAQLAAATGISVTTIQFSESKDNYRPPKYLLRIIELLEQNPHLFDEYGIVSKYLFTDDTDDV